MQFNLNLASRTYLDRRSVQRWLLLIVGLLAMLLAVNLLYSWRNLQQIGHVEGHLAEIEGKVAALRGSATSKYSPQEFTRVMGEIDSANRIIEADHFRWSTLLGRFEELLPDDVAIRSLKPNYKDRSLQIAAVARDTAAMTELLDTLLTSADMGQVYLLNQAQVEQPDGGLVVSFSIVIREAF
jgi:type IV pilus assembly protein PilN